MRAVRHLMQDGLADGVFPGAALLAANKGQVMLFEVYGHASLEPRRTMTKDTVFDLASLTKPLATAVSLMILIQNGYVSREDVVQSATRYIQEIVYRLFTWREGQFFYLNGRPIRSGLLAVMLERPYAGRLQVGRYPLAVVHIRMDPRLVDVNVHPRKAEVRFAQERAVYQALGQAVKEALEPFPLQESFPAWAWPFADAEPDRLGEERAGYLVQGGLKPLGQMFNTYLVAASHEGLVLVDQHAAHEQVLYERLSAGAGRQPLSAPVRTACSHMSRTSNRRSPLPRRQPGAGSRQSPSGSMFGTSTERRRSSRRRRPPSAGSIFW